jgi:hypothetical protein
MQQDDALRGRWYYCLDHKRVEPDNGCRDEVRLGPYDSQEEAAAALGKVEERNVEWDTHPAWVEDE